MKTAEWIIFQAVGHTDYIYSQMTIFIHQELGQTRENFLTVEPHKLLSADLQHKITTVQIHIHETAQVQGGQSLSMALFCTHGISNGVCQVMTGWQ